MFANGLFTRFSNESFQTPTSDAPSGIENHQPTSPKAPSTDRRAIKQPNAQENIVKLRVAALVISAVAFVPVFLASSAVSAVSIAANCVVARTRYRLDPLDILDTVPGA
ncbi:hypothetical protein PDIDSM_5808 [Penicillium digitatum]|nr:hypothetical protein PDIDSM_5808 [Penicillium digitatum]